MSSPVNSSRCNQPTGTSLEYDLTGIRNVTNTITKKTGFEGKVLIDVMNELEDRCVKMVAQCKSQYPSFTRSNENLWLTSIDQDNDIVLAHTIERADFPILFNTPRMCDPGITQSKNWSLQNYIETRLYLYIYKYRNKTFKARNNSQCSKKYVFDFRPFTFELQLPTNPSKPSKKIYVHQWIAPNTGAAKGFKPYTRFSTNPNLENNGKLNSSEIFKIIVEGFQERNLGQSAAVRGNKISLNLPEGKNYDDFINFLKLYDGIDFIDSANSKTLPKSNFSGNPIVTLTDDVTRILYYDLVHDGVVKIKPNGFEQFKSNLIQEFNSFNNKIGRAHV